MRERTRKTEAAIGLPFPVLFFKKYTKRTVIYCFSVGFYCFSVGFYSLIS